jgi:hypothetical protein
LAEERWTSPSVGLVRRVFPMYPLTVEGVARMSRDLARA